MLVTFRNYYTANIAWILEYISVTASTKFLSNQQQIDFQIDQKWKPNFFIGQKVSLTLIGVGGTGLSPVFRYWAKLWRGYIRFPDFWSIPYKRKLS